MSAWVKADICSGLPERVPIGHVRFGSEADICSAQAHVRFTPIATTKADMRHAKSSCLMIVNAFKVLSPLADVRVLERDSIDAVMPH
jgi:hypothetical protein